ncbi:MAG: hypothetical protein PHE25_06305 [Candidatus Gracilibacteria bacterium]|nr:hypothetical protein [Candidatus Gracilibacteria bacterium]
MKKYLVLLLLSFVLVSCGKQENQPITTTEVPKNTRQEVSNSGNNIVVGNNTGAMIETGSGEIVENSLVTNENSTEKNSNNFISEKLKKVKDKYGSESYSGTYLTGIFLWEYEINNFENDITYTLSGEIYDNYIQRFSKEKEFNKQDFLSIFEKFKSGNYVGIKSDFEKNRKLIPFYPVCCAWMEYIYFDIYNNGILMLEKGGNGGVGYRLDYITYNNGKIYMISKETGFFLENSLYIDNVNTGKVPENYDKTIIGYFKGTEKNEIFNKKLDLFKKEINNFYK